MPAEEKSSSEKSQPILEDGDGKPPWRNIVALAIVVAALLALVYLSPLRAYLGRLQEISDYVRGLGWLAPVVLAAGVAILVGAGFPRLLLCGIAGMALGFWSGLLWAQVGSLLGNYFVFLLVRLGCQEWAQQYLAKRGKLHDLVRQKGISGVVLARQLPAPGILINLACGLLPIRQRDYLIGTLIGQLPLAIPCTLIGAGALQKSSEKSLWVVGVGVALAVLAWGGLRYAVRWLKRDAKPQ